MDGLTVLYEDRYFIAVNKPTGIPAQPDRSGDEPISERVRRYLVERAEETHLPGGRLPGKGARKAEPETAETPYLEFPHRIDRPTSGAVLFAKTRPALVRVSKLFADDAVKKLYWAAVDAPPPAGNGTLVHYLRFDRRLNKSFARDPAPGEAGADDPAGAAGTAGTTGAPEAPGASDLPGEAGTGNTPGGPVAETPDRSRQAKRQSGAKPPRGDWKKAVLRYRLVGRTERFFLLEIELLTGRHHQIRAQLARAGCRIKGDLKYGYPRSNPGGGIHLHARSIAFVHPFTGKPLTITADPPDDPVWNAFPREP